MAGALTHLVYHIVFSTKRRAPLIEADWQPRLHEYLGGIVKGLQGTPISIGGMPDHVHMLVRLRPSRAVSDIVRDIKANSSGWARDKRQAAGRFQWQRGYGAFSVSESVVPEVRRYIENQQEHHRKMSFHDEFVQLLDRHGVAYDPQYLWND